MRVAAVIEDRHHVARVVVQVLEGAEDTCRYRDDVEGLELERLIAVLAPQDPEARVERHEDLVVGMRVDRRPDALRAAFMQDVS
jgi:hypothetical protein